jgi:transcriptional regulator with XRE-family HTH domain
MVSNRELGLKVRQLRLEKEMTQEEVAKALGVTPGYISNVENNRTLCTLKVLIYFAELTNVSLDYLAGSVVEDYRSRSQDYEVLRLLHKFPIEMKEKVIETLRVWQA